MSKTEMNGTPNYSVYRCSRWLLVSRYYVELCCIIAKNTITILAFCSLRGVGDGLMARPVLCLVICF